MRRGVAIPLAIGVGAAVLTAVYASYDPRRALVAWLAAYGFGLASALGALTMVMVLHVTGAEWWRALRPIFLSPAAVTPLFVPLFVPIGASLAVYPWSQTPTGLDARTLAALEHQRTWNSEPFFLGRAAFYLATFTVLAVLLYRQGANHIEADNGRRDRTVSAVGLPVLAFAFTFASFDWLMSLEPAWVTTMYGLYVFTSGLVSALAIIAVGAWLAQGDGLLADDVAPDHFHALGRLLLMAVILWAYIAFFQLLLVWIADIPAESRFYRARAHGGWVVVNVLLFLGRFLVPFLALLSRSLKRSVQRLAIVGAWLVFMSALDFAWLVIPGAGAQLSLADAGPFVCIFALAWAYGAHLVHRPRRQAGSPSYPRALEEALTYRSP
jgi:hypothetical protein